MLQMSWIEDMDDLLTSVLLLDKEVLHMQHPPLPCGVGEVVDSVANHRGAARGGTCSDMYAHIGGEQCIQRTRCDMRSVMRSVKCQ